MLHNLAAFIKKWNLDEVTLEQYFFNFLLKGPVADAADKPQPWRLTVQPYDEDDNEVFFCFSILMEHRWNKIDRGKPKYTEKNLSQCHFVHQKSHVDRASAFKGRRLAAWATARTQNCITSTRLTAWAMARTQNCITSTWLTAWATARTQNCITPPESPDC